jgi:hypothetical protein
MGTRRATTDVPGKTTPNGAVTGMWLRPSGSPVGDVEARRRSGLDVRALYGLESLAP